MIEKLRSKFYLKHPLLRAAVGELFGTFLLVFIGESIVAQYVLGHKGVVPRNDFTWIQICVGWGFAVAFSIFVVAKVSGGHINPAVTIMLFTFGKVNVVTTIVYFIAQTIGAFLGAAATYLIYFDSISAQWTYTSKDFALAGIFTTFPPNANMSSSLSATGVFFDQVAGTGLLCLFIAAILDPRNEVPGHLHSLLFGFVIMMVIAGFGLHIGSPINPARDFGPRLFALIIFGPDVFTLNSIIEGGWYTYFLLPVVGPLVGGVLGGWLYYVFAGYQIPDVGPQNRCAGQDGHRDEKRELCHDEGLSPQNVVP